MITYNEFIKNILPVLANDIAKAEWLKWYSLYKGYCEVDDIKQFVIQYFLNNISQQKFNAISQDASKNNHQIKTYVRYQLERNSTRDFRNNAKKNRVMIIEADMPNTTYYGDFFMAEFSGNYTETSQANDFAKNYIVINTSEQKTEQKTSKQRLASHISKGAISKIPSTIPSTYEQIEYEELLIFISTLSPKYQRIIELRLQGSTVEEIAKALGVKSRQIHNYLNDIQKRTKLFLG